MKTLVFALAVSVGICVMTLAVAGCVRTNDDKNVDGAWTYHGNEMVTKVVEIENHRYILMDGYECGGIIHAESCPCRK